MAILNRKPKPKPDQIYVAHTGFAYASPGAPTSIPRGARRRGSDPIVIATFPDLWLPDGADDVEIAAARAGTALPVAPLPAPRPGWDGYGDREPSPPTE